MNENQPINQTRRHLIAATLAASTPLSAVATPANPSPAGGDATAARSAGFVTPEQFGALGYKADDTQALQKALATGRHVYITGIYHYQDATLELRTTGQKLFGPGELVQLSVALKRAPSAPDNSYPASQYPAVKLSATGCSVQLGSITAAWEAVQIAADNCSVLYTVCKGDNATWYDGILCYANNPAIIGNTIEGFGKWPVAQRYALRGDGIFLSSGPAGANRGGVVAFNQIRKCAKNALFVIGQQGWVAQGNVLEACAMSCIQLAFLNELRGGNISHFTLTGNIGRYCGADSIDINNSSGSANEALFATINGNSFDSNGWLYNTSQQQLNRQGKAVSTPDGAGYTLIGISDLRSFGNYFHNTARTVAYMRSVHRITLNDDGCKTTTSPLDDTDGLRLSNVKASDIQFNLTVAGNLYRADGDNTGTIVHDGNWHATSPGTTAITTPNGTVCPIYRNNSVTIHSGVFISNAIHPLIGCQFSTLKQASARFVGKVEMVDCKFSGGSLSITILDPVELAMRNVQITGTNAGPMLRIKNCINGYIRDLNLTNNGSGSAITFHGTALTGVNHLQNIKAKNHSGMGSIRIEQDVPTGVAYYFEGVAAMSGNEKFLGGTIKKQAWS